MNLFQRILTITAVLTEVVFASGNHRLQRVPIPAIDSLLSTGIEQVLLQQYHAAGETFRKLSADFPDHPAGYLYQAAVLQSEAMDYEERLNDRRFDSLLAAGRQRSETMIRNAGESPWGYYYLGTTLGYDSYARAERGDWFGAATKGMSAASNFEKATELDSTFYDAKAGIGTYYYWKSRKIEFLTWLPFVQDSREEGITKLEQCLEMGTYNKFAAMSSLVAILVDAGRFAEAAEVAQKALARYPENRIFLWGLATAQERSGTSVEAAGTYERLLQSILQDTRPNPYNELVCRLNLLLLTWRGRSRDHNLAAVGEILQLETNRFSEHLKERAADKFKIARRLEREIQRASN